MDRIAKLRQAIFSVMDKYIREHSGPEESVSYKKITDEAHQTYQLVLLGWHNRQRIYHVLFHVEIIKGKIWVQEDNTYDSVAEMLVEVGVSKQDIVLAYFSEFHRQHTEFAVS